MAIKLDSGFEVLRYSDLKYEKMTAEIQYMGELVGQISMDRGVENLEIEFFIEGWQQGVPPKFQVAALVEALEAASGLLREYDTAPG